MGRWPHRALWPSRFMFPLSIELATILWQLVHLWRQRWTCRLLSPARPQDWRLRYLKSWCWRRVYLPRLRRRAHRERVVVLARIAHTRWLECLVRVNRLLLHSLRLRSVVVVHGLDCTLWIHMNPRVLTPPTSNVLRRILESIPLLLLLVRILLIFRLIVRKGRTLVHLWLRVLRVLRTWIRLETTSSII